MTETTLLEPNLILITLASTSGATGIALLFVGVLSTVLIALGNKHYVYAGLSFVFFPMAYVYCFTHARHSQYAWRLLLGGSVLFAVFIALLWWELSRLGLDFWQVMATTRPKH